MAIAVKLTRCCFCPSFVEFQAKFCYTAQYTKVTYIKNWVDLSKEFLLNNEGADFL